MCSRHVLPVSVFISEEPAGVLRVSPEALGFLSAVGVFVFLMILVFLYLNNKLSIENAAPRPHEHYRKSKDLPGEREGDSGLFPGC
ncbi:hypothetical protein MHYP_G00047150 [Metynnis hypsauchen]